jgi:hypothetical protein
VQFESATPSPYVLGGPAFQVVTQQAGEATVTLSRSDTAGPLRVEVATDPSSPFVGVNVGAVDQTVTFADGQSRATLTVPILAGAPNPGRVGVNLSIKSVDPAPAGPASPIVPTLDLEVVASDPALPPKVVLAEATAQGILLGFNKPMNPAGVSDVNNYTLKYVTHAHAKSVPVQSARYDPATQTVTLVPKQPAPHGAFTNLTQVHGARPAAGRGRGRRSNVAGSLTDLQGNPINATTTPGKVELRDASAPPGGEGSL